MSHWGPWRAGAAFVLAGLLLAGEALREAQAVAGVGSLGLAAAGST